jgi:HTH-type transcriptional regulator/antitoxin MqsA
MVRDIRPFEVKFAGRSIVVDAPGDYCTNCNEAVFVGKDLAAADRALHRLKAQADGLLLPEEIRQIRKKLRLTQSEASTILGGGPNAFHRYERGIGLPSQAVSNLLRVLAVDSKGLDVLRAQASRSDAMVSSSKVSVSPR